MTNLTEQLGRPQWVGAIIVIASILLVLLGCPAGETPAPRPPAPPPVVVVPPPPLPPPPPIVLPEPPPDTVLLVLFPARLDIPVSEVQLPCIAWRFPTGHVALRRQDEFRSINAYGLTCGDWYRTHFTAHSWQETRDDSTTIVGSRPLVGWPGKTIPIYAQIFVRLHVAEQAVTPAEQAMADQLVGESWASEDTTIVTVQAVFGGVQPTPRFAVAWRAWSEGRGPGLRDSTWVVARWGRQTVRQRVSVIAYGWFVAPVVAPRSLFGAPPPFTRMIEALADATHTVGDVTAADRRP